MAVVVVRTTEVVVHIINHTGVEEELLLNFDFLKIQITDGNQLYHSR